MASTWSAHDPFRHGKMLLNDFKELVSFCKLNYPDMHLREIATKYMAWSLNNAKSMALEESRLGTRSSYSSTTGNEVSWSELSCQQKTQLVDYVIQEWHKQFPNGIRDTYVPFTALKTLTFSNMIDTDTDEIECTPPTKRARFHTHVHASSEDESAEESEDDGLTCSDCGLQIGLAQHICDAESYVIVTNLPTAAADVRHIAETINHFASKKGVRLEDDREEVIEWFLDSEYVAKPEIRTALFLFGLRLLWFDDVQSQLEQKGYTVTELFEEDSRVFSIDKP